MPAASTATGKSGMAARMANDAVKPAWSIVNPAISGPRSPEIEYPTASRLKLWTRSDASPSSPVAFCAATWNVMNATPTSAALANNASSPGTRTGISAPAARPSEPASMGLRTPMRSEIRPAATAHSIGRNA